MTEIVSTQRELQAAQRTVEALNQEAEHLNQVEIARLSAARQRALSGKKARRIPVFAWQGAAVAAVLVTAISLSVLRVPVNSPDVAEPTEAIADTNGLYTDLPILANGEDVDFYQDLEFLIWLESTAENAT